MICIIICLSMYLIYVLVKRQKRTERQGPPASQQSYRNYGIKVFMSSDAYKGKEFTVRPASAPLSREDKDRIFEVALERMVMIGGKYTAIRLQALNDILPESTCPAVRTDPYSA
jgi:hypothetical protein